jgi:hypothetical protein
MFSYATKSDGVQPAASNNDPNFKQVSVLLHGDGTNGAQNNTILDSSANNLTVTRNGTVTQGTYTPFSQAAGYWSNYFDGVNDRLTIADNANLRAGTSSFTLEAWVYRNVANVAHTIFAKGASTPTGFVFGITSSNTLRFTDTSTNIDSTGTIPANAWTYVAVVREGTGSNQLKLYINGTNDGTGTSSTDFNQTTEARIGENRGATEDFNGYISNLRFVIGTAVYTSNFTPSTTPLTAITNTRLLTCQSNRFVDNSSNNFTLTLTNTPQVKPWSPFAPTSAYSTSVEGGSLHFLGTTGNYLSSPSNSAFAFGAGNFTIEYLLYPLSFSTIPVIFDTRFNETSAGGYSDYILTNGIFNIYINNSTIYTSASAISLNAWTHIAITRSGTSLRVFLNGVQSGSTVTNTTNFSDTQCLVGINVGSASGSVSTNIYNGYISNFRLLKGTALYTSNFTAPTAPFTAITNTSFLLNGTNAGIVDNAIKSNSVTVGATQVNTSVVKYGTGSISFNGTTSVLNFPNNIYYAFGTGNFTIEAWVYPNSVTVLQSLIDTRSTATATTGILISITALGFISVVVNNAILFTSSTGITISAWTHVAVVKSGTTITLYLNGTKPVTGSGTSSTSLTDQFLRLGASAGTAAQFFNGYLDEVRITNGVARYLADFTAPTAPFPNL